MFKGSALLRARAGGAAKVQVLAIKEVLDLGHGAHSVERVGLEAKAE